MESTSLVARVLAGDQDAERELYDSHVDRVYRLVYRMVGDGELAADYTQDTFIRAFDRLATFRGEAALSTWITAIAISVALAAANNLVRVSGPGKSIWSMPTRWRRRRGRPIRTSS